MISDIKNTTFYSRFREEVSPYNMNQRVCSYPTQVQQLLEASIGSLETRVSGQNHQNTIQQISEAIKTEDLSPANFDLNKTFSNLLLWFNTMVEASLGINERRVSNSVGDLKVFSENISNICDFMTKLVNLKDSDRTVLEKLEALWTVLSSSRNIAQRHFRLEDYIRMLPGIASGVNNLYTTERAAEEQLQAAHTKSST